MSAANSMRCSTPASRRPRATALNRLGVPPPKKIKLSWRPCTWLRSASRSASRASTYSCSGSVGPAAWELKSQYGHLRTHQGIWIYKASGGRAKCVWSSLTVARCGSGIGQPQALFEQGHGAGAVAELVLLGRRQFGAGAVAFGDPEQRVVAKALGAARLMQ